MSVVNPEFSTNLVDKLIKYQLECAEVLHKHFMGNENKKEQFFKDMFDLNLKEIIEQNKYLTSKIEYLVDRLDDWMLKYNCK